MRTFHYEAIREPGQTVRGSIEAEEPAAAAATLLGRGYHVLRIEHADGAEVSRLSHRYAPFSGFRRRDQVRFSRDLATLLRAGLPLVQSLGRLRARETRKGWKNVCAGIQAALEDGRTFSQSLAQYPGLFNEMYVNLVRAGEEGGNIAEILQRLAQVGEHREELRSKVRLAFVYPLVMLGMGAATVLVLLTVVVPMFNEVFAEMGQSLPLPTQILVSLSAVMQAWWFLIVPGIALAGLGLARFLARPAGVRLRSVLVLRVPRLGAIAATAEVSIFARTLGMLLDNGVPMVRALEVAAGTLGNHLYSQDALRMRDAVRDGIALSRALDDSPRFPDTLASVASVGEDSGTLPEALLQIAGDYDRDLEREIKVFTTLLEPAMIIAVGAVVGFIVSAIILPIFQLGDIAQP